MNAQVCCGDVFANRPAPWANNEEHSMIIDADVIIGIAIVLHIYTTHTLRHAVPSPVFMARCSHEYFGQWPQRTNMASLPVAPQVRRLVDAAVGMAWS